MRLCRGAFKRNETEKNESCTEVIGVKVIGISEMEIRIQVGSEGDQDGGDYQVGNWDYLEVCNGPRWESNEEECYEAGYPRPQAHVAVPVELLVLTQPPVLPQLPEDARLRVVLYNRHRK